MATFRKLLAEVNRNLYEKVQNDAKAFRYENDEREIIQLKIKYLNKHLRDIQQHPKTEKEQILVYGNLGLAYYKLDDYVTAREYYNIQQDMGEQFKDLEAQRMAHANIGILEKNEYHLSKALERFNLSLDIAMKANNKVALGRLYNNIANIYEMTMDIDQAIEYQKKRFEIATELNDTDGLFKSCACLAALHHTLHDYDNAISYYEQLMTHLRRILKVIDTLADDASGSEDGGYVNLEEAEEGKTDKETDVKKEKSGKLSKVKSVFKRKK